MSRRKWPTDSLRQNVLISIDNGVKTLHVCVKRADVGRLQKFGFTIAPGIVNADGDGVWGLLTSGEQAAVLYELLNSPSMIDLSTIEVLEHFFEKHQ